jgi:hypothetical protein
MQEADQLLILLNSAFKRLDFSHGASLKYGKVWRCIYAHRPIHSMGNTSGKKG